jgi:hypothetical protein
MPAHPGPFLNGSRSPIAGIPTGSLHVDTTSEVMGLTDGASAEAAADPLIGIEEVQKSLNRSRASVYRYTNTDPRNLNPPFNPRKLNPEYRSDQKEPLLFHPNEVARFARDILRIKEVTVEVLNSPSTATQQLLGAILDELRSIRLHLEGNGNVPDAGSGATSTLDPVPTELTMHRQQLERARPAA